MTADLKLLRSGISAIHNREYARAVEVLEAFCSQNTALKPSEYFEAQRWLIKAYQRNGQVDLAIYLCRQMTDSTNVQTRAWAKSNIEWLQEESKQLTVDQDRHVPTVGLERATSVNSVMLDQSNSTSENSLPLAVESLNGESNPGNVVQPDILELSD
jgi:pentatricopeptide repeat protein